MTAREKQLRALTEKYQLGRMEEQKRSVEILEHFAEKQARGEAVMIPVVISWLTSGISVGPDGVQTKYKPKAEVAPQ